MIDINLKVYKTCSSTNDIAFKEAQNGSSEGNSFLSYIQTKGRGRNSSTWESLKGNLFLSTIIRPEKNKSLWHQLSLIVGFSILEVLIKFGVDRNNIELKWPNDVLVDKKKISGVLLEAFDNFIIIGIGLNILKVPKNETKWKTTKLNNYIKNDRSVEEIAYEILNKTFQNYLIWKQRNFIFFQDRINSTFKNINEEIEIKLSNINKPIAGIFLGLAETGAFKIKVGDKISEYYSIESFSFLKANS